MPSLPKEDQWRRNDHAPSHRKTTSLQTTTFKTASQKLKEGDGSWFGAAATHDPTNVRTSDAVMHERPAFDDRPGSISPSVNFSYPRGLLESPSGSSRRASLSSEHTLVYDANSRRMVPQGELAARQQAVQDRQFAIQAASEKPVKKKKQDLSRSGSHLAKGTVGRTKSVQLEPRPEAASVPASRTPEPAPVVLPIDDGEATATDTEDLAANQDGPPSPIQPQNVVVDEFELKHHQGQEDSGAIASVTNQRTTPSADEEIQRERQSTLETLEQPREEPKIAVASSLQPSTLTQSSQVETPALRKRESVSVSPAPNGQKNGTGIRRSRVHSESPARTARFATASDQLVVKHEPPPRSLSPRKSALKHFSARPNSPSDSGSEASGPRSVLAKDDSVSRKKSVRVSFNDKDTVVVGNAAEPHMPSSPVIPSPQVKKSWTSIIGRHKKDNLALDEDETMTPRPALPAFGSVREKKTRELDERPLVRPSERNWSPAPAISTNEAKASSPEPANDESSEVGQSNDHAVGAILAQESAARNEANTSKYREPLPPVVTSMEHSGYISNSSMSSDDEGEAPTTQETERDSQEFTQAVEEATPETTQEIETVQPEPSAHEATVAVPKTNGSADEEKAPAEFYDADEMDASVKTASGAVPTISVSGATPTAKDEESPRSAYFDVPGRFPDESTSETSSTHDFSTPLHETTANFPAVEQGPRPIKAKPAPITPIKAHEVDPGTPSPQMDKIQEEKESSDGSEVFSDAYEDLSELEGDGFLSLDAVLTTPVKSKMSQKLFEQSRPKHEKPKAEPTSPKTADEWEQAKSYWKSLTADKRRQLELEAMEEAGEEADFEGTQKPKKTKKRRSMDKAAGDAHRHPDRTYQIQPGTKWAREEEEAQLAKQASAKQSTGLKKSMRGEAIPVVAETSGSQGVSMRKSLRSAEAPSSDAAQRHSLRQDAGTASGGGLSMRKSMRSSEDGTTQRQNGNAGRPMSYHPATNTEPVRLHKRMQSYDQSPPKPATAAASTGMKPTMRRRGSDSSESSFRRARAGSAGAAGGFAFRNTMRGSMREPPRQAAAEPNRSSRFSLRSLSPTPFRRGSASSPPPPSMATRMRPSMRSGDSSDGSGSRLRIFGRSSSKKPTKTAKGSRFGDSSDEEDTRPAFSSRFADSTDEEDEAPARPVSRGLSRTLRSSQPAPPVPAVPKGPIRSDSPDLPDSDDDLVQPKRSSVAPTKQAGALHRSGSGRGSLAAPAAAASASAAQSSGQTGRLAQQRRGSFMSSILRRKKDPSSKISRDVTESAARRDTGLERSTEQLVVMRSNSGGRLQKKGPNWPFPEDEDTSVRRPATAGAASTTSHGAAGTSRPALLQRRTMSSQAVGPGFDGVADSTTGTPKKKKFGALRKMFGIHN